MDVFEGNPVEALKTEHVYIVMVNYGSGSRWSALGSGVDSLEKATKDALEYVEKYPVKGTQIVHIELPLLVAEPEE